MAVSHSTGLDWASFFGSRHGKILSQVKNQSTNAAWKQTHRYLPTKLQAACRHCFAALDKWQRLRGWWLNGFLTKRGHLWSPATGQGCYDPPFVSMLSSTSPKCSVLSTRNLQVQGVEKLLEVLEVQRTRSYWRSKCVQNLSSSLENWNQKGKNRSSFGLLDLPLLQLVLLRSLTSPLPPQACKPQKNPCFLSEVIQKPPKYTNTKQNPTKLCMQPFSYPDQRNVFLHLRRDSEAAQRFT